MICLNEYYRGFNSDEIKSRRIKLLEQELERLNMEVYNYVASGVS